MGDGSGRKPGRFAFVAAGMSFIPVIGILFGLIAVALGLVRWKSGGRKLALIGAGGIAFSFILYGGLFYFGFVQRGGIYDDLRTKLAQSDLNSVVPLIETYRLTHGEYPKLLEILKASLPKESFGATMLYDPRISKRKSEFFYYATFGSDHYYLRGVAPDGKPFSPGALAPEVAKGGVGLGLMTSPPENPP